MKRLPGTVLVPIALLALAGGSWVYLQVRSARGERQRVADLLLDVEREVTKEEPEGSELSSLVTRIRNAGDPERDPRLRRALARIEVARGRDDRAWAQLQPLALAMEPEPDDQALGARLLASMHGKTGNLQDLRQALELAESAHRARGDTATLFLAWQCAVRLGGEASETRQRLGDRLRELAPDGAEAALVTILARDEEQVPVEDCQALAGRFEEVPMELAMALATGHLQQGAVADALHELDRVLPRAPALMDLRHLAATACWAFGRQSQGAAPAEVERRRSEMAAHLRWLLANAPAGDPRRGHWRTMLESR